MATFRPSPPISPTPHPPEQEGAHKYLDYYDIMVIGKTGTGKSTTADKLLIANPTHQVFTGEQYNDPTMDAETGHIQYSDMSMWHIAEKPDEIDAVSRRLKDLVFYRSLDEPHEEVRRNRMGGDDDDDDDDDGVVDDSIDPRVTEHCELLSSDANKIRVLDIPGFYGSESATPRDSIVDPTNSIVDRTVATTKNDLSTMRKILHIKMAQKFKFNRIVYFLPEQGVLKRHSSVLQTELAIMEHYFGHTIFESMVVIATESTSAYKHFAPGARLFPPKDIKRTREFFQKAMKKVFNTDNPPPDPPIEFISLQDTCEDVLSKIQNSKVIREGVELEFNPSTCARCNIKIRILKGEEDGKKKDYNDDDVIAMCTYEEDWSNSIPYQDSTCHPMMIPRYTTLQKIAGGLAHLITLNIFSGKWPSFYNLEEACINCGDCPKERGCMKVKTEFTKDNNAIKVRHVSTVDESFVIKMESDCVGTATTEPGCRTPEGEAVIVGGKHCYSANTSGAMGYSVNCAQRSNSRGQGDGGERGED